MYLYITVVIVMHSCCGYFICEIRLWWSSCWWQWHVCTLCIFCFFHRTVHSEKGRKESTEWQIIDIHTFFVCKYNRISSDAATAMPQICCSAPAFFRNRIVQETCVMYVCVCSGCCWCDKIRKCVCVFFFCLSFASATYFPRKNCTVSSVFFFCGIKNGVFILYNVPGT